MVSYSARTGLSLAFPQCCGRNSGLVAFGLICGDILDLLKNIVQEKVMLEHPKEQVSCLQGQTLPRTQLQI